MGLENMLVFMKTHCNDVFVWKHEYKLKNQLHYKQIRALQKLMLHIETLVLGLNGRQKQCLPLEWC